MEAGDRYCLNCGRRLTEGASKVFPAPAVAAPALRHAPLPPPEPTESTDLVACPRCGASNAARRRRCGRCDGPLGQAPPIGPATRHETGPRIPADPLPADAMGAPVPELPPRGGTWRRRGIALVVVGLGAIVGTGLGVAAATGMGPFATVEPVPFDAAAYPDDPRLLSPVTGGSSSTAPDDGARSFGPELTFDGDLTTAWVPDGEAEGALLRHGFVAPVWITRLEIATGDQHDDATFAASGKVTRAMVDLGTQRVDVTIAPTEGVQIVQLPDPVLTDEATWEITGISGEAPAMAEVRYVGWPADEEDRAAHRQRQ